MTIRVRSLTKNRYVVMRLRGGLGNQLFQYASGVGIARHLDADLLFDSRELRDDEHWLPQLIGSRYGEADRRHLVRLGFTRDGGRLRDAVARRLAARAADAERRLRGMTPRIVPAEGDRNSPALYRESMLSVDVPAYLSAYFQTERYFSTVTDEIRESLALPPVAQPPSSDARPTVAVSFRRGDYIRLGWELSFGYYEKALEAIARDARVREPRFLLFGDDRDFLRLAVDWMARFGPASSAYDIAQDELSHLVLLRDCDHCVIANSSFAWWGAWLGDQVPRSGPRVVIAPDDYRRFGPDILPERWAAVPSRHD
jgi:hypothetical protein